VSHPRPQINARRACTSGGNEQTTEKVRLARFLVGGEGKRVGRPTAAVDYVSGLGFAGENSLGFCICHFKFDFVGKKIERLLERGGR
jgi:hypothetical protein